MGSIGNIANGQVFKLNIGLMLVSTLIMMLVTKLRKLFTKNKKKAIIYALIILVSFALIGLLSSSKVLNDTPLNSYFGFEILFLGLGILHLYIMRKYFPDLSDDKSEFFPEFLLTLVYTCLGLIAFTQIVNRFRSPFSFIFMSSTIWFILPTLFYKMYEFAMQIAVPIYQSWIFPSGKDIKDPTKDELANPRVISFEFSKTRDESDITNFRVKAPQAMQFGKLFYFFIVDYNARHPESKIEFLDEVTETIEAPATIETSETTETTENTETTANTETAVTTERPSEWVFHFKPNWWSPIKHINFSHTVAGNNITEDTVIICRRVNSD